MFYESHINSSINFILVITRIKHIRKYCIPYCDSLEKYRLLSITKHGTSYTLAICPYGITEHQP